MGLTGCGNFLKYSMFFFNAIILIAGCGLLGVGIHIRTNSDWGSKVSNVLGSYMFASLAMALIASGGVVILLSFLGCCGAIKEVRCMLGTFFVLLLMMLLGLFVGGILVFAFKDKINNHVLKELYSSLNTSYGVTQPVTEAWNFMQKTFRCCGVYGDMNSTTSWMYYRNTAWYLNQTESYRKYVPLSCCADMANEENSTRCMGNSPDFSFKVSHIPYAHPPVTSYSDNPYLYTEGCYSAFMGFLSQNIKILGGVAAGVALTMIVAMSFAICLCRRIKDDYYFD